jgi:hypothetical protein
MKPSNDREAITLILDGLVKAGHTLTSVIDDTWNKDEKTPVSTVAEAVDLATGVDEAFVLLDNEEAWIYFVLGNDPEEVACNYTTNLDPDLSNITDPWWNR